MVGDQVCGYKRGCGHNYRGDVDTVIKNMLIAMRTGQVATFRHESQLKKICFLELNVEEEQCKGLTVFLNGLLV